MTTPARPAPDTAPAYELPALAVPCGDCGAAAGALCTSHGGTRYRTANVHRARTATHQHPPRTAL
ncbi:zinc finger domain-containing protein [Actinacidiphila glaucinigra]|uniref:zinc finger domain-containing protein n=1 Tax=Actinacidiphila glaucinigra TaxID=235986 RepID=UPI003D8E9E78